jgi:hypothetical protein
MTSDPVAVFFDSILYVCYFLTDNVVIQLTPVGAGIWAPFHQWNMAKDLQTLLPKCNGYLGIVVPERKAGAVNQWTVSEMWLSACVGCSSRKSITQLSQTVQSLLARSLVN